MLFARLHRLPIGLRIGVRSSLVLSQITPAAGRWGRDDFNESECLQQRTDVEIHALRPALLIHQVDLRLHQLYPAWARDRVGCGSAHGIRPSSAGIGMSENPSKLDFSEAVIGSASPP